MRHGVQLTANFPAVTARFLVDVGRQLHRLKTAADLASQEAAPWPLLTPGENSDAKDVRGGRLGRVCCAKRLLGYR
jgi:hypothetical protein